MSEAIEKFEKENSLLFSKRKRTILAIFSGLLFILFPLSTFLVMLSTGLYIKKVMLSLLLTAFLWFFAAPIRGLGDIVKYDTPNAEGAKEAYSFYNTGSTLLFVGTICLFAYSYYALIVSLP